MMNSVFSTPILLNVFNRPNETRSVLKVLREQKVPALYVHCDGVRVGNEKDSERVAEVRQLIDFTIDWPCEVHKMYEESNQGCGLGPYRAMKWFFENVEEGIILEDDCVPHPDFFLYCQELLERYRDDDRIGIVGGTGPTKRRSTKYSYEFTAFADIWGWATWRRFWNEYDFYYSEDEVRFTEQVLPFVKSQDVVDYWLKLLRKSNADGESKTYWDYQLHLQMLAKHKIHISPNVNMISNIGFGADATHTFDAGSAYANKPTQSIMPLKHPRVVEINARKDNYSIIGTPWKRIKRTIKRLIGYGK